ncbi:MAG: sulfite exporter TauE/SafE family protein [Actinomycetota bacterium]|nr:sulfite exporter TauE/SafE family protein [Actinomycetota bacterium]
MHIFVIFALAGLAAQLVDGSLGMAYGVTSTTVLLALGTSPAIASASVHLAEVGTTLASGAAHWRFGNVDWGVVARIALPGAAGAVLGAYVLTSLSTEAAEPYMAALLIVLGTYVLLRFSVRAVAATVVRGARPGSRFLAPLGLVAGFIDATGGGGWGPVATTTLLSSGRLEPRKVVGSVDTSEFVVALAAGTAFLVALQGQGISWITVAGLLVGGVIAAPFAAWLVRIMPARLLGTAAGGLIVITNVRTVLPPAGITGVAATALFLGLAALWVVALVSAVRSIRSDRAEVDALTGTGAPVATTPRSGSA